MTDPDERRTLRNERTRLLAEYDEAAETAELIKIRIATADGEGKRISAENDDLDKPLDGGTITGNVPILSDRERVVAERLRIYPELAAATLEMLLLDFRLARLDIALNNLVVEIYEIGRRLDEPDTPTE